MKIRVMMKDRINVLTRKDGQWEDMEGTVFADSTLLSRVKLGTLREAPPIGQRDSYAKLWKCFMRILRHPAPAIKVGLTTYGELAKEINMRLANEGNHNEPLLVDLVDKSDILHHYPELTEDRVFQVMKEVDSIYQEEQGVGLSTAVIKEAFELLTPETLVGLVVVYQDDKWFTVMNTPEHITLLPVVGNDHMSMELPINDFTTKYNNGEIVEVKL